MFKESKTLIALRHQRGIYPLMCWPNTQRVQNLFDSLDSGKFSDFLLEVYVK